MKEKYIEKASILGIIGNLFLSIIKGIIGFTTNSQSMIADALNSMGDVFSSLMSYIGNKIARTPRDEDHDLGHGKAEYIYSLIISEVIILVGLNTIYKSIISIYKNEVLTPNVFLIIVCIITIITKLGLYLYTNKLYKKYNNILLEASSKDHISDIFITVSNLIAIILSFMNVLYIDGIIGILICIWLIKNGVELFIKSYNVLMDKTMDLNTKDKVLNIVKKYKDIKKIQHFNTTPVGYQYQISLTIFVDGNMKTIKSHEIADKLEKEIIENIEEIYLAVIHVNPI
jgi:cation diffusion facilitator family transporter